MFLAHFTDMNNSLAAVSWRVSTADIVPPIVGGARNGGTCNAKWAGFNGSIGTGLLKVDVELVDDFCRSSNLPGVAPDESELLL